MEDAILTIDEYNKIKSYSYKEYCDYLQIKYGIGLYPYMTKSFNKNPKSSRTDEGLIAHHKFEDQAIMLSNKNFASKNPYEWQLPENLIYCNMLEHLLLHILICEDPHEVRDEENVGIGGVLNFLVPELNDMYSGFKTTQVYRQNWYSKVIDYKNLYIILIKRFKDLYKLNKKETKDFLCTSFNDGYKEWTIKNNKEIFKEIINC